MPGEQLIPGLVWGVKHSFIRYVAGLPDGRCSADGGSELIEDDLFRYSPDDHSFDALTGRGVLKYRGDVRFAGHNWLLFVRIANPWLELESGTAVMTVEGSLPDEGPSERLAIATLTLRRTGECRLAGENVQLTNEGAEVFGGVYSAGEVFDDLVIVLSDDVIVPGST